MKADKESGLWRHVPPKPMAKIDVTIEEVKQANEWWNTLSDKSKLLKFRTSIAMRSLGIKEEVRDDG